VIDKKLITVLRSGGVVVIPTDTLYGLVARADKPEAIRRIYELKRRQPEKKLITLISSFDDLERFGVMLAPAQWVRVERYWPGPFSLILPAADGNRAFRLPKHEPLLALLRETGPLVAPSANWEGEPPARTVAEARRYFGAAVDYYLDGGQLLGPASTLLDLTGPHDRILRS
jgi:L-threonylcarbamoyladenylate synthase